MRVVVLLLLASLAAGQDDLDLRTRGSIRSALVVYPPYGAIKPVLVFALREGGTRTVRLGEALIDRPDRPEKLFRFLGCERDKHDKRVTIFVFDVHCDGKKIQKVRWRLGARAGFVGDAWFVRHKGVYRRTDAGRKVPREGYERLLHQIDFARAARGLRILSVREGSPLAAFDLEPGDVVESVGGIAVKTSAELHVALKTALEKNRVVEVRIMRARRLLVRRFDPR